MLPKESGFNQSETLAVYAYANRDVFTGFFHHGDTICHPKSSFVTTKLNGCLHGDATIMRSVQTKQFSLFLQPTYVGHVKLAAAKHWRCVPK